MRFACSSGTQIECFCEDGLQSFYMTDCAELRLDDIEFFCGQEP